MSAEVPFELDPAQLAGKVAVITGASRGLGAGIAERLAAHGMRLGLCARHEPTPPRGARAVTGAVDVRNPGQLDRFASAIASHFGPIDLWINNAGVVEPIGPLRTLEPREVDEALAINLGGVINGTRAFVQRARLWTPARRVLVNVSSGAATSIYEGWSVYGAAKAAVDHLTEIVAAEEPDLFCWSVAPGVIDTDMQARIRTHDERTFPAIERFRALHRDGGWSSPAWVADHLAGLLTGALAPDRVRYRVPDEPRG